MVIYQKWLINKISFRLIINSSELQLKYKFNYIEYIMTPPDDKYIEFIYMKNTNRLVASFEVNAKMNINALLKTLEENGEPPQKLETDGKLYITLNNLSFKQMGILKGKGFSIPESVETRLNNKNYVTEQIDRVDIKKLNLDKMLMVKSLENLSRMERHILLESAIKQENLDNPNEKITMISSLQVELDIDQRYKSWPQIKKNKQIERETSYAILKQINEKREANFRVIVDLKGHYTAIDIDKTNGVAYVVDAVGDARGRFISNLLAESTNPSLTVEFVAGYTNKNSKFVVSPNIQKDHHSCSLFAFDHCKQLAKLTDQERIDLKTKRYSTRSEMITNRIKDDMTMIVASQLRISATNSIVEREVQRRLKNLKQNDPRFFETKKPTDITWEEMGPNFYCNLQSMSQIDELKNELKDEFNKPMPNGLSFNRYIEAANVTDPTTGKSQNNAINYYVLRSVQTQCAKLMSAHATSEQMQQCPSLRTVGRPPLAASPNTTNARERLEFLKKKASSFIITQQTDANVTKKDDNQSREKELRQGPEQL